MRRRAEFQSSGDAVMRCYLVASLMVVFSLSVRADAPQGSADATPSATLLKHLLQDSERDRAARPIGQCVIACGDRLIEVDLCLNGDCPVYECRTGLASCPTR